MRHATFRRYVRSLAVVVGGGLLLTAGFSAVVNPFNLYEGWRIAGVNDYKYRLIKYQRLIKPAEVRRLQPECLILGTSRMQTAIDPGHPGWRGCRTYNLALNNAGIYESLRYFQHAAAMQPPRDVVLELEQIWGDQTQSGFSEERLAVKPDGTPNRHWWRVYLNDLAAGLLSMEALRASWNTIAPRYERRSPGPEDGFWEYTPVDRKMLRHGQRALFRQLEQEAFGARRAPGMQGPVSYRLARAADSPREADSHAGGYRHLRAILRAAHHNNVRLHLVIAPSHARLWNGFLEVGSWTDFEARKRMMVFINEDEARRANREPFPLWDFSGFNSCTTEPVPADDDRQARMQWYFEAQHFTKELGNLMLDRILGYRDPGRRVPEDFGVRIDSRNIDAHLAAIRAAGDEWRRTHPEDVAEIARFGRGHATRAD